ncbi:MAG: SpoIIE family protein phosphatase [Anaerolineae bacterium]|nr:SpoIIE family protein phosphatase [Anaerolineae bacterium]
MIRLRRLLEKDTVHALLASFETLLPGAELALIEVDGRVFAGHSMAELPADAVRLPLAVRSKPAGMLVARQAKHPEILHALHTSLSLLLSEAQEKRDLVEETLDRYREINLLYQLGETMGIHVAPAIIPEAMLDEVSRIIDSEVSLVLLYSSDHELVIKSCRGAVEFSHTLWAVSESLLQRVTEIGRADIATQVYIQESREGTVLCAPLKVQEHLMGFVLMGRFDGQDMFTAGDEKLLMAMTHQAAIALETHRLYQQEIERQLLEKELSVGRQIQLGLLPTSFPDIPGWEFAATYEAARQVGGDLYDFFHIPDQPHRLGIVIADVTGKGVPAAMFMALSRTIIRAESRTGDPPTEVLQRSNRLIVDDNRSNLFMTAFYATLDTLTGQLVCANAGHDYPLWLHTQPGRCEFVKTQGLMLGAFKSITLTQQQLNLAPGDCLVLYTDGVTEAMNQRGQFFGEERLKAVVEAGSSATANELLTAIMDAVRQFIGDYAQSDDLTLFIIKRQFS